MVSAVGATSTDISGNTYRVVLSDDFSNGYQTSKWGPAFGGGTYWNGAFSWSSADVGVRNGELQVTDTRHADGSWTAGGFSSFKAGNTITYGTVEFDARVEQAQGTQAAILMWPASDLWPRDGEIDILETPKTVPMHSSHWEGSDGSHQYDSIFSDYDPGQTHHYKMTWLPSVLTIEVDGKVVARWTDANAIPDTAMGFGAMGYVAASGEEWLGGGPDRSTPNVVTTHIDNVVMSQWTSGSGKYTGGTVTKPPVVTNPPPVVDPPATTTPGAAAAAAKFGGKAADVWTGHADFGGSDYVTYGAKSDWGTGPAATLKPTAWDASWSTKLAFDNFVQTTIDLTKAGSLDVDLMLVSAKRGTVTLGAGDDQVTWVAHSNNGGATLNTMVINTGAGNDTVTITDAGRSSLADYDRHDNGKMYNANYDGRHSIADVTFGSGQDSVTVEGKTKLVLHAGSGQATAVGGAGNDIFHAGTGTGEFTGGAGNDSFVFTRGDGHVVIKDFTSGVDQLQFSGGLTKSGVTTKAATEGGVAGLLVTYDTVGDSVFLAHVTKIAAADMLFA